jgi:class 3 adenylate cyclase/tetratricopeptide (TPR) repeat protein
MKKLLPRRRVKFVFSRSSSRPRTQDAARRLLKPKLTLDVIVTEGSAERIAWVTMAYKPPRMGERTAIKQAVRIARQEPFELKVGKRASVVCCGVMPSGMLRHPLFLSWAWSRPEYLAPFDQSAANKLVSPYAAQPSPAPTTEGGMQCPRCQHENEAGAKFCEECAAPLARTCSHCGRQLSATAKFCPECAQPVSPTAPAPAAQRFISPESYTPKHLAEKILTSKSALEGERKQVTVLFADLKGSMELLADRDPEEARKILDPVLERMMEAVHRYEGTVNQVMGDGIMALFGAPLAHEDHAVRACYTALRMQESVKHYADEVRRTLGAEVKIRVGLNSGEVVVRAIGSDLHMDYTAVGQTTHLAARMEQIADPGAIVITPETLALVEGYVEVKPIGPMRVKGLAEAIAVYEVTGVGPAQTRMQASARRGLTRFVGRDAELGQLRRAQHLAGIGRGQIAAVVGEAGAGKSRLTYELIHSQPAQGWLVLEGASVSYGKATSYLPVIGLLKGYFEIQDRDDVREIRENVTNKVLALDRSLEPTLPALLALLDVPVDDASWQALDPSQRRQRTLDAVKRLVLREAREQPVLVVFEDLHWIDGETQALLDSLVDSLGSARLLLLVNYRPEYQHGWGSRMSYSQIRLDTLLAETAGEMLEALLGDDPGLEPLKQLLVERGNPFFLEETVRMLVETKALEGSPGRYHLTQPIHAIQVPSTVQPMLATRIDRLDPERKRLLQIASVIGKDVPLALLQAIADLPDEALLRGLDHLRASEFLYETGLYADLEYTFMHALTHEVAYGGLLQQRRRELHARLVGAIETLYRDRLGEHIERLAHHAVRGELREKAVDYLRQAGLKAASRSALSDAKTWFEQALGVLVALPQNASVLEQAVDIRLELRPVLNLLGEGRALLDSLREAEALADRLNDDRRRGRIWAYMMNGYSVVGELDEVLAIGARTLEMARRLDDLELRILTTSYLEQVQYLRAEYVAVIELSTEILSALPGDWVYKSFDRPAPISIFSRYHLVRTLGELGRFTEAARWVAEATQLAEPTHHPFTLSLAAQAASVSPLAKGDWAEARVTIERWITVLRAGNIVANLPGALARYAWALAQLGETSEAQRHIGEGEQLQARQEARGRGSLGRAYHPLGQACLLLGRLDQARHFGEHGLQYSRSQPGYGAEALHLLGEVAIHPDRFDPDRGEAYYRQALALADPRGMRPLIAHCHLGLGKLYRRTGKREQAQEHLTTATTMYREMDMRFWLEQAEVERQALA